MRTALQEAYDQFQAWDEPPDEPEFDEPDEPHEDDYTSEDGRNWYQSGRLVFTVPENENAEEYLRAHADATGYFPNAWMISDHGNMHPFSYHQ